MSRITAREIGTRKSVAYGLDHAIGWWASLIDDKKDDEIAEVHTHGPCAKPGGRMMVIDKVKEWMDPAEVPAHQKYFDAMTMDLDPGLVK